MCIVGWNKN